MFNPIMAGEEGNKKRYRSLFGLVAGAAGVAMVAACNPVQAEQPQPKPTIEWTLKPTATPQNQPKRSSEESATNKAKWDQRQEIIKQTIENPSVVEVGDFYLNGPTIIEVEEGSYVTVAEDDEVAPIILPSGVNVLALNTDRSYKVSVANQQRYTVFYNLADIAEDDFEQTNMNTLGLVYKLSFSSNAERWHVLFSDIAGDIDIEEDIFGEEREDEEKITPEKVAAILAFALQGNVE